MALIKDHNGRAQKYFEGRFFFLSLDNCTLQSISVVDRGNIFFNFEKSLEWEL